MVEEPPDAFDERTARLEVGFGLGDLVLDPGRSAIVRPLGAFFRVRVSSTARPCAASAIPKNAPRSPMLPTRADDEEVLEPSPHVLGP